MGIIDSTDIFLRTRRFKGQRLGTTVHLSDRQARMMPAPAECPLVGAPPCTAIEARFTVVSWPETAANWLGARRRQLSRSFG